MTKEEFAALLDGRSYLKEMTKKEEQLAKQEGLVVVFGASDDNMELRGAVNDEVGCFNGGIAYFTPKGLAVNECEEEQCPYYKREKNKATPVTAIWAEDGYSWTYKTEIPHAVFDIIEDGEPYCRGIVFALNDCKMSSEMV